MRTRIRAWNGRHDRVSELNKGAVGGKQRKRISEEAKAKLERLVEQGQPRDHGGRGLAQQAREQPLDSISVALDHSGQDSACEAAGKTSD